MPNEFVKKEFDVTELDESELEGAVGGAADLMEAAAGADVLGCKDNTNCPTCTDNSGNCVAGCT